LLLRLTRLTTLLLAANKKAVYLEQSENSPQTLAAGLFGFNAHRRANSLPWNI